MTGDTLEFPYREKPGRLLFPALFFGVCGAMGAREALNNDAGVIINGLELGVAGATRFYWGIAAASAIFVALAVRGLLSGSLRERRIRLSPTYLQAPPTRSARIATTIQLTDVRGTRLQPAYKDILLVIEHTGGTLSIAQSMLPSPAKFQELCAALSARLGVIGAHPAFAATANGRAG